MSQIELMGVNFGRPDVASEQDIAAMAKRALSGHFLSYGAAEARQRALAFARLHSGEATEPARPLTHEEQHWLLTTVLDQYGGAMPELADGLAYVDMASVDQARTFLEGAESTAA